MKSIISPVTPFFAVSSVLGLIIVASSKEVMINVGPFSNVSELDSIQRNDHGDGIVPGTRSCGGPGEFLQWRYETCRVEDIPCQVPADGSMNRAELDFIPSKNISSLGIRLIVYSWDAEVNKELNFAKPILNSAVKKGQAYTLSNIGGVTEELKGKPATFQYILYDKASNDVEICAECDIKYV